jgi:hypothetical protein
MVTAIRLTIDLAERRVTFHEMELRWQWLCGLKWRPGSPARRSGIAANLEQQARNARRQQPNVVSSPVFFGSGRHEWTSMAELT